MKCIYVAGPCSGNCEDNVRRAAHMGNAVIALGAAPFVPHFFHYCHIEEEQDYETWMTIDFAWLERADAIFMFDESPSALREWNRAKELGMPRFRSLVQIKDWLASQ